MSTFHVYGDKERIQWLGKFNSAANPQTDQGLASITSEATRRHGVDWQLIENIEEKYVIDPPKNRLTFRVKSIK